MNAVFANDLTTNLKLFDDSLETWVSHFLTDRKSKNLSANSVRYYRNNLKKFIEYCSNNHIYTVASIKPDLIRSYIIHLRESGHNAGGVQGYYRAIKAFLNFYIIEMDLPNNLNPIARIRLPKAPEKILPPISLSDLQSLIDQCGDNYIGKRDKALLLFLLDTGARGSEVSAIRLRDINLTTGEIRIENGKGGKTRVVYVGQVTRKALRHYLRYRISLSEDSPLFASAKEELLKYGGIRQIIERRAKDANVNPPPGCHDFRRAFCINALRAGMPMAVLKKLSGHSDYQVLNRYLKVTDQDAMDAFAKYAPVDQIFMKK